MRAQGEGAAVLVAFMIVGIMMFIIMSIGDAAESGAIGDLLSMLSTLMMLAVTVVIASVMIGMMNSSGTSRSYSSDTFGIHEHTSTAGVRQADCDRCGRHEHGQKQERWIDVVVAGRPVWQLDRITEHYCDNCAAVALDET